MKRRYSKNLLHESGNFKKQIKDLKVSKDKEFDKEIFLYNQSIKTDTSMNEEFNEKKETLSLNEKEDFVIGLLSFLFIFFIIAFVIIIHLFITIQEVIVMKWYHI